MSTSALGSASKADESGTEGRRDSAKTSLSLALHVEPDLAELAEAVIEDLEEELHEEFQEVRWEITVVEDESKDPYSEATEIVRAARRRLLDQGWDLVVCLTSVPLRTERRPVTAFASATDGVGVVSVPALGAVGRETRLRKAIVNLVEGLVGEHVGPGGPRRGREARVDRRLSELAAGLSDPHTRARHHGFVRFSSAVVHGNLRLLVGMVRANRPWRVVVRLSRAMVAAVGVSVYVLASSGYWRLALEMSGLQLAGATALAIVAAIVVLIAAHDLWERASRPEERERVVLFNTATLITITIGVAVLYAGLFAFNMLCSVAFLPSDFVAGETGTDMDLPAYLRLALFSSTVGTLAGALGSMTESDLAVREAAYGYRPDSRTEERAEDDE